MRGFRRSGPRTRAGARENTGGSMAGIRAVRFHDFGGPEVLAGEAIARPTLKDGDVLVRVHAAGVNPLDTKMRQGFYKSMFPKPFPVIPGWDFSGVIESVGRGVKEWKAGDAVYGRPDFMRDGSYADYIAVKETEIARKPETIGHVHAAAVPLAALTAWQAMFDIAKLEAGQRILIHAAAGGVGILAVQLAKWNGAYVYATASAGNRNSVKSFGADETIDYNAGKFEDVVKDVDVVFDLVGREVLARSWGVLKKGGVLVTGTGEPSQEEAAKHGVRAAMVRVLPNRAELDQISKLIDSGLLKPYVGVALPLEQARKAHELVETRHGRGKVVLRIAGKN